MYFSLMQITSCMLSNQLMNRHLQVLKKNLLRKDSLMDWNQIKFHLVIRENYLDEIRKKYPILGSEVIKEVKARLRNDSSE